MNTLLVTARLAGLTLFAALAALPLSAVAATDGSRAQPGLYLGGGVGYDKYEGEDFSGNINNDGIEDERVTYKGVLGLRLSQVLSLEAQYIDFGTSEDGNNVVDARGVTAGVVLHIPVFKYVNPYVKAGALFWDTDASFNNIARDDTGNDFTYGAGLRFAVAPRLDIRAEYEGFELDEADIDHISAIVQFNF